MESALKIELGYTPAEDPGERFIQQWNSWAAPRLPSLHHTSMRRWADGATWVPPETQLLVRHRALDGHRRIVTTNRHPPDGFEIEYDLGLVHRFAQPGTRRLIAVQHNAEDAQCYICTRLEGTLDYDYEALGHVEEAPLPMLDALELRRDPVTNEEVLVAGVDDPLYETAIPVGHIGFIESYPIQPRHSPDGPIYWSLAQLFRTVDPALWRHDYSVSERRAQSAVSLGTVWTRPGSSLVALCLDANGMLTSEMLASRQSTGPTLKARLRWAAAPLGWTNGRPRMWATRAAAGRLSQLRAEHAQSAPATSNDGTVVGYLRGKPHPGWSPLFSAVHPALPDQYITRSEQEAIDMGYRVEGVLGYVLDKWADRSPEAFPTEVKWAWHFGQGRRYLEGHTPR
jgi:hypothetical protein